MASVSSVIASSLLAVLASGCALAITAPAPDRQRFDMPKCDTGKGLVVADGLWGTLFGIAALAAMSNDEAGPGLTLGGVSALAFASAVRGNRAADECSTALVDYQAAIREELTARKLVAERRPRERVAPAQLPLRVEPRPSAAAPVATGEPPSKPEPIEAEPSPRATPPVEAAPSPSPRPADDDWSAFWKELP